MMAETILLPNPLLNMDDADNAATIEKGARFNFHGSGEGEVFPTAGNPISRPETLLEPESLNLVANLEVKLSTYGNCVVTGMVTDIHELAPHLRQAGIAFVPGAKSDGRASLVFSRKVVMAELIDRLAAMGAQIEESDSSHDPSLSTTDALPETPDLPSTNITDVPDIEGLSDDTRDQESAICPGDGLGETTAADLLMDVEVAEAQCDRAIADVSCNKPKTSTARVRRHRRKLRANCTRLDLTIGSDVAGKLRAIAKQRKVPIWQVIEEALQKLAE